MMDDKLMLPYMQKRSRSRSRSARTPSPHRSRGDDDIPELRSHSKSTKYRDHEKNRGMKDYFRSRSPSPGKSRKYKSSKADSRRMSRSRSRSPYRKMSRSRSRSYPRYSRGKSFSPPHRPADRSPGCERKRHKGNRDAPKPNKCLGVFGLSVNTTENQLLSIFSKYGPVEEVTVVIDAKTRRPKGYCFVYFQSLEDARLAKEHCSGMEINGRSIRVDYSITERAHTPTPGCYMGKPSFYESSRGGGGGEWSGHRRRGGDYRGGGGGYRRRSPSPYYGRRSSRYRSRSRSYSPRRY